VADTFAALIAADPWIAHPKLPVPVLTERKGDLAKTIELQMAKIGMCVAVVMPDAEDVVSTGATLALRVRLVAQVDELVLANQAKSKTAGIDYRPALAAVVRIMNAVHQQPNGLDVPDVPHRRGVNEFFLPRDRPFQLIPDPDTVTYHVIAHTTLSL
jgi:hypothetical protein